MELFGKRPPRRYGRNIAPHVFLGLAVAAVVVLIFARGGSDQPDPPPESRPAAEASAPSSVPGGSGADDPARPAGEDAAAGEVPPEEAEAPVTSETTVVTTETIVVSPAPAPDEPEEETAAALSAEASRYLLGLSAFQAALDGLASDIGAANRSWDAEKGDAPDEQSYRARYRQAESALENILDRVRGFRADVRAHPVPAPVAEQGLALSGVAAGLVDSAEGVLAGLRRPRPDDGSARRAALADFEAAAADFSRRAAALAVLIEQNAPALGLTAGAAGAAAPPDEAAAAYLRGLADFREELDGLAVDMGAVNRSWDAEKGDAPDEQSYRARYRQAESALEAILDRVRRFHAGVQAHPIPASARALGAGPEALTARLVDSAEGVLAGLRRPRPDDGSARRTALADFNDAAREFGRLVEERTAAAG